MDAGGGLRDRKMHGTQTERVTDSPIHRRTDRQTMRETDRMTDINNMMYYWFYMRQFDLIFACSNDLHQFLAVSMNTCLLGTSLSER